MEYLITFEDKSNAVLAHHGVKGMRWGKWNPQTAARYADEGKAQGGGGGSLDEEDREEILRENDLEGLSREEALRKWKNSEKSYNKERLAIQSRQGAFGNSAEANRRIADRKLRTLAAINTLPTQKQKALASKGRHLVNNFMNRAFK